MGNYFSNPVNATLLGRDNGAAAPEHSNQIPLKRSVPWV